MSISRSNSGAAALKLVASIIIIIILMAFSVFAYNRWSENDKGLQCQKNLELISAAVQKYAVDNNLHDSAPVKMDNLTTTVHSLDVHGYLYQIPACPSGGKYSVSVAGEKPKCSIGDTRKPFTPHVLK